MLDSEPFGASRKISCQLLLLSVTSTRVEFLTEITDGGAFLYLFSRLRFGLRGVSGGLVWVGLETIGLIELFGLIGMTG